MFLFRFEHVNTGSKLSSSSNILRTKESLKYCIDQIGFLFFNNVA